MSPPLKLLESGDGTHSSEAHPIEFGYVFKPPTNDLLAHLNREKLGGCHGVLHAAGLRRFSDLSFITKQVRTR